MSKPLTIIIADTEATVVDAIELKFLETLRDNIMLEVITDPDYFNSFFSTPRTADILVVGEELYDESLLRHDIKHRVRVLTRNTDSVETTSELIKIYKYSTAKEIYAEIMRGIIVSNSSEKQKSKLVLVYSPIGGSGKTTVALGIASALALVQMARVLYINAESMNTFGVFLDDPASLPSEAYEQMRTDNSDIYGSLKQIFARDGGSGFTYLPPAANSLSSAGGNLSALYKLGSAARASGDFDYVIVDVDSAYTNAKGVLMSDADKVLLVYMQDKVSAYKMDKLQKNVSCSDTEKYVFVCNKYKPAKMNYFLSKKFISTAEIEADKDFPEYKAFQLGKSEGIKKLALTLTLN